MEEKIRPENEELIQILNRVRYKSFKLEHELTENAEQEYQWCPTAPLPNDICRVSPFFPLNRKSERKFFNREVIVENAWGRIAFTGPQLSTHEESVLLAILALISDPAKRIKTNVGNVETFAYQGPILPIIKLAGLSRGKENYKFVKEACIKMMSSVIEIQVYKNVDGQRKVTTEMLTNILIFVQSDHEKNKHTFIVNPYFYNIYTQGSFALLDIGRRNKIKSEVAKSLYRFVASHSSNKWKGHCLTLAEAINIRKDLDKRKKKEYIKNAIKELISSKLLDQESKIGKDIVTLKRHFSVGKLRKKKQI